MKELEGIILTQGSLSQIANTVSAIEMEGQIKYNTDRKQVLQLHSHCMGHQYNINSKLLNICIIITISSEVW